MTDLSFIFLPYCRMAKHNHWLLISVSLFYIMSVSNDYENRMQIYYNQRCLSRIMINLSNITNYRTRIIWLVDSLKSKKNKKLNFLKKLLTKNLLAITFQRCIINWYYWFAVYEHEHSHTLFNWMTKIFAIFFTWMIGYERTN